MTESGITLPHPLHKQTLYKCNIHLTYYVRELRQKAFSLHLHSVSCQLLGKHVYSGYCYYYKSARMGNELLQRKPGQRRNTANNGWLTTWLGSSPEVEVAVSRRSRGQLNWCTSYLSVCSWHQLNLHTRLWLHIARIHMSCTWAYRGRVLSHGTVHTQETDMFQNNTTRLVAKTVNWMAESSTGFQPFLARGTNSSHSQLCANSLRLQLWADKCPGLWQGVQVCC